MVNKRRIVAESRETGLWRISRAIVLAALSMAKSNGSTAGRSSQPVSRRLTRSLLAPSRCVAIPQMEEAFIMWDALTVGTSTKIVPSAARLGQTPTCPRMSRCVGVVLVGELDEFSGRDRKCCDQLQCQVLTYFPPY